VKYNHLIAVLLVCGILTGTPVYADQKPLPITITLKSEAFVKYSKYRLSDIATISGTNEQLKKVLATMFVGKSPRIGYVDKVRNRDLLPRIERMMPNGSASIVWNGPDMCKVRTVGVVVERQKIISVAERKLNAWLDSHYKDYELHPVGNLDDLYLPKGQVNLVPELKDNTPLNKRMSVWVDMYVNNEHYQSMPVWFAVTVRAPVLVMTRKAKRGDILNKQYFANDVVDIAVIKGKPVGEDQIENTRLRKDLEIGDAVTDVAIEKLPNVVKGAQVIVQASAGNVTVKSVAVAMKDGMPGDKIKVRKPDSQIEYVVKVIGKNMVTADKEL